MSDRRGFVNAHTHLYSGLVPLGMPAPETPPASFLEILERVWWRLDRALDPAALRASARLYVAEALLAGTTTLVDHHESPRCIEGSLDVLADACDELGARALLCYGATERNGGVEEAQRGLSECVRFLRENDRPLVRGAIGLHASFTVGDDTLRQAAALAREAECPLHLHLAEDAADVEDARRRGFDGPLERLLVLDALPPRALLAHGVHLDETEVRLATAQGAWLVQNPRSNRGNRVGYPAALPVSGRVALGTDGYPADMREEEREAASQASRHGDRAGVGAQRLAAGHELAGELLAGTALEEDAVTFDGDRVRTVTVGGRRVVDEGRLLTVDLDELRLQARREATRLWERMRSI